MKAATVKGVNRVAKAERIFIPAMTNRNKRAGESLTRLTFEIAGNSSLVVSLDCRYKPDEVFEAFLRHYRAEFDVQTVKAENRSKLIDSVVAEGFARYATEHFEEDLPNVLSNALQSGFKEAAHRGKFDWGDPAGLPAKLKGLDPELVNSAASRMDSKKRASTQECIKFAADSARSRITKQRRNSATFTRAMSETQKAKRLKKKIMQAIRHLVAEQERIPKRAAVARQAGVSRKGNMTQALDDVLVRYGWSFRGLVLEALSSDF